MEGDQLQDSAGTGEVGRRAWYHHVHLRIPQSLVCMHPRTIHRQCRRGSYADLQSTLDGVHEDDVLLLQGNFNDRVRK